jgi:hypothetical protein
MKASKCESNTSCNSDIFMLYKVNDWISRCSSCGHTLSCLSCDKYQKNNIKLVRGVKNAEQALNKNATGGLGMVGSLKNVDCEIVTK